MEQEESKNVLYMQHPNKGGIKNEQSATNGKINSRSGN